MNSSTLPLNPATTFLDTSSGTAIDDTAPQVANQRHPLTLYEDGVLYVWTKISHLRRSPARPDEVGIPIQCLQNALSPSMPFNLSHLVTAATEPRTTNAPRSQVGIACVACRKAGKKCSESRPCGRCIERGIASTCVDAPSAKGKKSKPPTTPVGTDAGALSSQGTHCPGGLSTDPISPASQGAGMTVAPSAATFDHLYAQSFNGSGTTYGPTNPGPFDSTGFNATSSRMGSTNLLDDVRFNAHAVQAYNAEETWKEVPFEHGGYFSAAGPSGKGF